MYAGIKFIPLILLGLAALLWGIPASHRLKPPLDIGAALVTIAGVLLLMSGILLTAIPHFIR